MSLTVLVLGDANTGKTNLITRFAGNTFSAEYPPTIEEIYTARLSDVSLTIFDLGGAEEYDRLRTVFLGRECVDFFLLVYAVDDLASWENLDVKWVPLVRHWREDVPVVAVGCKADLKRRGNRVTDLMCSAREGWGCREVFERIVEMSGLVGGGPRG